jgi:GT2 family glycosyltransferase
MISIVLVHYHAEELIVKAIQSVLTYGGYDSQYYEFIIVDNSQNFDEKQLLNLNARHKYHNLGYNSGFARAVNYGIKNSTGEYVILMNQDACLIEENSLKKMIDLHQTLPVRCILGCALKDEKGEFQESVWIDDPGLKREWRFGPIYQKQNPNWQEKFEQKKRDAHSKNGFVHRINGAFVIIPVKHANSIDEILFDEDFFLYGEDIEWALRIKRGGWKFYHINDVQVVHIGSASSSNESIKTDQIKIMDWLVLRKRKGKTYLKCYILLLIFNKKLDLFLAGRKDKMSPHYKACALHLSHLMELKNRYLPLIIHKKSRTDYFHDLNLYK